VQPLLQLSAAVVVAQNKRPKKLHRQVMINVRRKRRKAQVMIKRKRKRNLAHEHLQH